MGGPNSGRRANPINVYTPTRAGIVSIGESQFELPNLSGVRDGGTKSEAFSSGSGAVVFVNDSGQFSTDSTNLYWDDTNNRLGIGTTTPISTLSILGGGTEISPTTYQFFTISNTSSAGVGVLMRMTSGNTGTCIIQMGDNNNAAVGRLTYANNGDYFSIHTGGVERTRLTATGLGIGLTVPITPLHISGGAFTIGNTTAPSTPVAAGAMFVSGGALWYIGSSGTQTLLGAA